MIDNDSYIKCVNLKSDILLSNYDSDYLKSIKDRCSNIDEYKDFIKTTGLIMKNDGDFFLYDYRSISTILTIIGEYRFDSEVRKDKEYFNLINRLIGCFNVINNLSNNEKRNITLGYMSYQVHARGVNKISRSGLTKSIIYDKSCIEQIKSGKFSENFDPDFFIISLYYLMIDDGFLFLDKDFRNNSKVMISLIPPSQNENKNKKLELIKSTLKEYDA